jgi:alkaline phosphatase D
MKMSDRRQLLKSLAAASGVALLPRALRAAGAPALPDNPFRLGVSSGFPTDRSVVLWTRLAPNPDQPAGGMPPLDWQVGFEVATDDTFRRIIARGRAVASAQFAHSVHHEVRGLDPARDYWYRFTAGDYVSAAGRTRTLPAPGAAVASMRVITASCQNYEHGHYAALRHLAADTPDLVIFLGDYIYEGAPTANRVRRHTGVRCVTLDNYRQRYALYQSDPALQAAHAAAPWFATWDDHEVANDYAGTTPGRVEDPAAFLARRAAAYQAWYEHLPVPPAMAPRDGSARIYWRARLGRLATLHMLDQRQYRSPEACPKPPQLGGLRVGADCADLLDPARTMLGAAQEQWLADGLQQQPGAWTLLAQGTPFAHVDEAMAGQPEYWTDSWTGYPAARQRLLDSVQRARAANPVVLSGDFHCFMVSSINAVPERLDSPLVASEFVGTSISSDSLGQDVLDRWRANNPHLQRLDGTRRGYLRLTLSAKQLRADLITVDDASRPDSGRSVAGAYVVEAGNPAILPA